MKGTFTVQKLTKKELESQIEKLRYADKKILDTIAPIIWHLRWQDKHIKELEEDLRKLRVQDALTSRDDTVKRNEEIYKKLDERKALLSEPKHPLHERLKEMIESGKRGSEEWSRTLRWNNMREEEVDLYLARCKESEAPV